jgi:hypothetical protein
MACWVGNVLPHSIQAKEVRFGLRPRAAGFFFSSSFASGHGAEDEHEDDHVALVPQPRLAFKRGPSFEPMAGDDLLGGVGSRHRRFFL